MDSFIRELFNEDILNKAISLYKMEEGSLKKLGGFESFIYQFSFEGKEYILRITHGSRRTPEMIEAEMDWIRFLHQHGVNCSLPYLTLNGQLVETIGKGDRQFIVCAFDKVPGKHLTQEADNEDIRYQYGKLLGRMHSKTKEYQTSKTKRIEWFEDEMIQNFEKYVPSSQTEVIKQFKNNHYSILKLETHLHNYGLVHYDAHAGNFFVDDNHIHLFDFDDSQYAHFSADIAIVLFYYSSHCPKDLNKEVFIDDFFKTFMKGYLSENSIGNDDIAQIPLFLKQREFLLYAVIYSAFDDESQFDNWAKNYMNGRATKLENNIPFLSNNFEMLFKQVNQ